MTGFKKQTGFPCLCSNPFPNAFPDGPHVHHLKSGLEALRALPDRITKGKAIMPLYEHVFLARQDISSQQAEALTEQFKGVLEANEGKVGKVENWGLKTATYKINKNRKAHYVLMNVDAPAAALAEMERQMRLHEDILRYMTIRVEEHEDGPSAMMKKNDRDDRGPRGPRGGDNRDRGDSRPPRRDAPKPAPENTEAAAEGDA